MDGALSNRNDGWLSCEMVNVVVVVVFSSSENVRSFEAVRMWIKSRISQLYCFSIALFRFLQHDIDFLTMSMLSKSLHLCRFWYLGIPLIVV